MDTIPIATLDSRVSFHTNKAIKAVVTLIWPYSSSTRTTSILAAEPDYRLRTRKGQVRIQFRGPSAKQVATSRIAIGDVIYLSLQNAKWVDSDQASTAQTPGKSVDGELAFKQKLSLQIERNGQLMANVNVDEPQPSPPETTPPSSPYVSTPSNLAATPLGSGRLQDTWSSPAFATPPKRLSSGPFFSSSYDPFVDDDRLIQEKQKKRTKLWQRTGRWHFEPGRLSPEEATEDGEDDELSVVSSGLAAKQAPSTAQVTSFPTQQETTELYDSTMQAKANTTSHNIKGPPLAAEPNLEHDEDQVSLNEARQASETAHSPAELHSLPKLSTQQHSPVSLERNALLSQRNTAPSSPRLEPLPSAGLPLFSPLTSTAGPNQPFDFSNYLIGSPARDDSKPNRPVLAPRTTDPVQVIDLEDDDLYNASPIRRQAMLEAQSQENVPDFGLDGAAFFTAFESPQIIDREAVGAELETESRDHTLKNDNYQDGLVQHQLWEHPISSHQDLTNAEGSEHGIVYYGRVRHDANGNEAAAETSLGSQVVKDLTQNLPTSTQFNQIPSLSFDHQTQLDEISGPIRELPIETAAVDHSLEAQTPHQEEPKSFVSKMPAFSFEPTVSVLNRSAAPQRSLLTPQASNLDTLNDTNEFDRQAVEEANQVLPPTPQLTQEESKITDPDAQPATLAVTGLKPSIQKETETAKSPSLLRYNKIPNVISPWFSSGHSSHVRPSEKEQDKGADAGKILSPSTTAPRTQDANIMLAKVNWKHSGFRTKLSYYTTLSNLRIHLNSPSSPIASNVIDVLAVATSNTPDVERAKDGPRDYYTTLHIVDPSSLPTVINVQFFRPWRSSLPQASGGDVVLLRNFVVKRREGKDSLLSSESSAWCVWRFDERPNDDPHLPAVPIWARKMAPHGVVREDCCGPPVEIGNGEREIATALRRWWMPMKEVFNSKRATDILRNTRDTVSDIARIPTQMKGIIVNEPA